VREVRSSAGSPELHGKSGVGCGKSGVVWEVRSSAREVRSSAREVRSSARSPELSMGCDKLTTLPLESCCALYTHVPEEYTCIFL